MSLVSCYRFKKTDNIALYAGFAREKSIEAVVTLAPGYL